jgi:polar amino acid transport system substrate-binding protein
MSKLKSSPHGRRGMYALAAAALSAGVAASFVAGVAPAIAAKAAVHANGGVASVEALVPAAYKKKGTLTVAADATYAPNEFIASDGHTVIGMDADLMKALAAVMGLKVKIVNAPFASILAGLTGGKYDVGASSFTDNKLREKTVNFVDYFTAGESFFTKSLGGVEISGIAGLCGHSVAVEQSTTELADANAQSKKCKAEKKPAVSVVPYPDQTSANLALSSGRVQLGFVDSPVAAYQVKLSHGVFKLVGASYATAPYGLAITKAGGLDTSLRAALLVLMKNGTYTKILDRWGVQAGAIKSSQAKINGATS